MFFLFITSTLLALVLSQSQTCSDVLCRWDNSEDGSTLTCTSSVVQCQVYCTDNDDDVCASINLNSQAANTLLICSGEGI